MLGKLMTPKDRLLCIQESSSCLEALNLLEEHSLRNAPVLDASNTLYRGSLYRYHIYKHAYQQPQDDLAALAITPFLKNATKYVYESQTIYHLIFTIRDLPYIAVLNEQNSFLGVIFHHDLINFLAQAWRGQDIGYLIAIRSKGRQGDLRKLSRIVNRHVDIASSITLEKTDYDTPTQIIFSLARDVDQVTFSALIRRLRRLGYELDYYTWPR